MCGRTGLSLRCDVVQSACAYKRNDKFVQPEWRDEHNFGKDYCPSYNLAPTDITPVITSASNFGLGNSDERILKPMMWGMVPKWHKGYYKNHGLSTNNCRIENILTSKLYSPPLTSGNRCVILAEGFYEWQTSNSSKQPYYVYSPQIEGTNMYDLSTFKNTFSEEDGWNGINLLKMAGLYDSWSCEDGVIYSYSIITMESNSQLNWLHHRMPAILETEQEIADWLDIENVPHNRAINSLKPASKLLWYPVSTLVNNSREKSPNCKTPINPEEILKPPNKRSANTAASRSLMENWLKSDKSDVKRLKKS